ncbi:unnamed protein product [Psylliodes chrysocephalus]|uniref:Uncharacterized protein n=1 Tax=Psylliodes chrysocephalus TaxID=3402493 RepID=A0A9P0G713_9CUCU|nr:unnamed protein product [Psylliodes chrysocephala]
MEEGISERRRKYGAKIYRELTETEKRAKYDLSTITDEQIEELMNSIPNSDDASVYEDDDDSIADPKYDYKTDVLTSENDEIISKCLGENISDLELAENLPLELSNLTNVSEYLLDVLEPKTSTSEMATTSALPDVTAETSTPEVSTTEPVTVYSWLFVDCINF